MCDLNRRPQAVPQLNQSLYGAVSGVGDLVKINTIINKEKYGETLIHHVIPSRKSFDFSDLIFQYDSDAKYTASAVKPHLHRKTADWPPRPWTSRLFKQCGIMLTEKETKG